MNDINNLEKELGTARHSLRSLEKNAEDCRKQLITLQTVLDDVRNAAEAKEIALLQQLHRLEQLNKGLTYVLLERFPKSSHKSNFV
jgi:predicted  nucleic acid-binding Zn-ribbon protein